jgi:hypothetical protein
VTMEIVRSFLTPDNHLYKEHKCFHCGLLVNQAGWTPLHMSNSNDRDTVDLHNHDEAGLTTHDITGRRSFSRTTPGSTDIRTVSIA